MGQRYLSKTEKNDGSKTTSLIKGLAVNKGVKVVEKDQVDELSGKGYGTKVENGLILSFCESLYLVDRGVLEVDERIGKKIDFQKLLQVFELVDKNAWAKYLTYRDLRSRGYVVREGFGVGVDFRVYERGEYNKDAAKSLILSLQEGKPMPIEDMISTVKQSQRLKKELIIAVMNRRGETVYYSVSQMTMK